MEALVLKKVTPAEIDLLQHIGRQTFLETFSADNSAENMRQYLEESFSLEKLHAELSDENTVFYFAWANNRVVGYLKLNFGAAQTELKDERAVEIERIYVLREFHGKNAGQVLFEKALQIARQEHAAYIWLGVWEKNARAINFYQKNGFVPFDRHIFRLGEEDQTDLMMKLELEG